MHRLQVVSLLIDQSIQKVVFKTLQDAFGTAACTALSWFAGTRQVVRIPFGVGTLKRGQQLLQLCPR